MKIIDLLNKIANGEEVPKKIKYDNQVFEYREDILDYYCYDYDLNLMGYQKVLNDEVEILEEEKKDNFTGWKMYQDGKEVCSMDCSVEEKKIPEKLDYIHPDIQCSYNESELLLRIEANKDKINSIIDYLKSKGE